MTPNEYQLEALRTLMSDDTQATRLAQAIAVCPPLAQMIVAGAKLSSESGELNDAIVKHISYNQALDTENIFEECGDLLWYIADILSALGRTMEDCMQHNIGKLRIRYPEKFTEELAKERLDKKKHYPVCICCFCEVDYVEKNNLCASCNNEL